MFDSAGLKKQGDILDALETSYSNILTQPKPKEGKKQPEKALFNVKLDVANKQIFDQCRKYYRETKGSHSDVKNYDVKKVYHVTIKHMEEAFIKKQKEMAKRNGDNVQLLFHGTSCANMLSILKSGFRMPRQLSSSVHITGAMWGDGLYFSDQSTKSLRYATGAWGGSGGKGRKFMFLCNVAMGKMHIPADGDSWNYKLKKGYDSCFAKGGVSGVMNNEMMDNRCFNKALGLGA
jgi:poly [ADP-ribose] polymerase